MLQVLDAVDPVKPAANNACPTAVHSNAQEGPASSAVFAPSQPLALVADNKRESDGARHPTSTQERVFGRSGDCKRPGWRADCKDLAQRLLFSEDLEEVGHAQRGVENIQPSPASACINMLSCQDTRNSQQGRSTTK